MLLKDVFTGASIEFKVLHKGVSLKKLMGIISIGAVTLEAPNGNQFMIDPYYTDFHPRKGATDIVCKCETDEETFGDESYNLTLKELLGEGLTAKFYCGFEDRTPAQVQSIECIISVGTTPVSIHINCELE